MNNKTKWVRLEEARKQKHFSQEYCAKMLNVSRNAWINWENCTFEPSLSNLVAISNLLCVSTDYLLGNDKFVSFSGKDKEILSEIADKIKDIIKEK